MKKLLALLACLIALAMHTPVTAQTAPQNLSNVRVDELSDAQIRALIKQVEATGLSEASLEQVAKARGMSDSEIQKLRQRVNRIKAEDAAKGQARSSGSSQALNPGRQVDIQTDTIQEVSSESKIKSRIFGAELFNNANLTFEPNLQMATPANYVIGPGDVILIDIYGNSEASYSLKVSPEGTVNIEYVGVVPVGGLTVEAATSRIRNSMATIYSGLRNGSVRLNIAIGNIRSIKVMVTGEAQKPGTYSMPSLATAFNALYYSGGPTANGSMRAIEIIRGNRVIATLDVYEFLTKGYQSNNVRLQDQDVIRIPPYNIRAEFNGEVKRPLIFEALPGETLQDLLTYAGGFTDQAYRARIKVYQNTDRERRIVNIEQEDFSAHMPVTGNVYFVEPVLERFENRVTIEGAVFRPGEFELQSGLSLSQLIKKAEGLKEDAFLPRGYITRLRPDNQTELISFDVGRIMNGTNPDIPLRREDVVNISSIFDLKEEYQVTIDGEVRQPGTFNYAEKMSLEDLIIMAGGFTDGASEKRVEVSRRVFNSDATSTQASTAQVFQVDIGKDLNLVSARFELQPFDIVSVRSSMGYEVQRQVKVEGEVLYPGMYTIINKDERISDLVQRAGGLTALAYARGASLKRQGPPKKIIKNEINKEDEEKDKLAKLQRLQESVKDSVDIEQQQDILGNVYVGINMERILQSPRSDSDLILEEGDILRVPKQLQTVKVGGEVLYPVTAIYKKGQGFKGYISDGGGFSDKSLKRRSYVIYANGSVKSTKKFLFFNNYPRVEPGAEVFVPKKRLGEKLSVQEVIGIASGIASLGAIVFGILNLSK